MLAPRFGTALAVAFGAFGALVALGSPGCVTGAHPARAPSLVASSAVATGTAVTPERSAPGGPGPAKPPGELPGTTADESPDDAEESDDDGEGAVDDAFDSEPSPDATIAFPHPLAGVSDAEIEKRLVSRPASLGSMSIGRPSAGLLFNAVRMPSSDDWTVVAPGQSWATEETVHYLETAIHSVRSKFPDTQKLWIGDISAKGGGYLSPHLSHQAGRDVDISYYYLDGARWYQRADAQNLDTRRTWAFVRALVTETDVELLLIDRSLQKLLREEAEREGEDADWLDTLFRGKGRLPPLIRHAPGHATHLHIRFYSPIAQETGRRAYAALVRQKLVRAGAAYVVHVAKKGDTLDALAKRYHTTVRTIRRANKLRSNLIQAKRAYRIPQTGHAPPSVSSAPVTIPPRRMPPGPPAPPARTASQ